MRSIFSIVVTGVASTVVLIGMSAGFIQDQGNFTAYSTEIPGSDERLEMVPIPGGVFTMSRSLIASNEQASGGDMTGIENRDDEVPGEENPDTDLKRQEVRVDPFWMGRYEITWDQYEAFADELPENLEEFTATVNGGAEIDGDAIALPTRPYVEMSFGMGKDGFPAISMTHYAAVMFTRWLTLRTGHFYRLPTEAEWEFACRGGSDNNRWFGNGGNLRTGGGQQSFGEPNPGGETDSGNGQNALDRYEWHAGNSDGSYNRVGIKEPNPFGLHDMLGNVAEWTMDQYHEDYLEQIVLFSGSESSDGEPGVDRHETDGAGAAGAGAVAGAGEPGTGVISNPWFRPDELYPRAVRGGSWMDPAEELGCTQRRGSNARWKQLDPQLPKSLWWHTSASFVGFRVIRPMNPPSQEEMERYWIDAMEDY